MLEKTFIIHATVIRVLSMFNTTDQICNILTEKLKIKFSEEFPDKDLSVVVYFNPDAMSYAVTVFIYGVYESHSPKLFVKPPSLDKYKDRFIKSKGKPAGLKL